MAEQLKASRETPLDKLNKLIDWYELNKPKAGRSIQVEMTPKQLGKMLNVTPRKNKAGKDEWDQEVTYRSRTIVALKLDLPS